MPSTISGLNAEQQNMIMEVFHKTAKHKVPAVAEYIKEQLEGDGKFLVFAHHM